jgi:hypothetical protein
MRVAPTAPAPAGKSGSSRTSPRLFNLNYNFKHRPARVIALLVLMTVSRPGAGLIAAAAAGLALLATAVAGLGLLLRSESFAFCAGRALQRVVAVAFRLARRQLRPDVTGWLSGFRHRVRALLVARGWRITAATAASNLTLWLVLLACLRGTGLSQAQVPWQTSLAAFAFVRPLTALPVTPPAVSGSPNSD